MIGMPPLPVGKDDRVGLQCANAARHRQFRLFRDLQVGVRKAQVFAVRLAHRLQPYVAVFQHLGVQPHLS